MNGSIHRVYRWLTVTLCACLSLGAAPAAITQAGGAAPPNAVRTVPSQTTGKPEYVIRARVPLTILDVVVTDSKGHSVHGLKQADFTVLEDGKEMTPNSFEEHRSDEAPAPAQMLVKQDLKPNTFTNIAPTTSNRPLNILLLDSMNTPIGVQQIVQQQMLAFINKMQPGTRVAVLRLSTRLSILQGFTSDRELLKAAIASEENIARESPIEDLIPPATPEWECDHAALRGQYTLPAMNQIARYLSGMPGRKNLIWFSGSFPLTMEVDGAACYDFTDDMKAATDLLARAHVAIYPVDGRALDALAEGARAKIGRQLSEHLTMEAMAEQTGGKATYASNDLSGAAEDAVDSGSNFYTLTYTPTNQTLDTRFRTISVKVAQPGLHLVYRPGYYAVDPDTDARGKQVAKVTAMQTAMMRGGVEPTQVLFKVKVVQAAGTEDTLPVGNKPGAKQMKPPYRHYTISYVIDIHGIEFSPSADGNYRGGFEFGAMVYNADGDEVMNSASKEVSPILPPAVYQSMLKGGANARQEIDVPANGEYFLRIGVHDLASDRVGAIEIPVSSIAPETAPAVASQK